MTKRITLNTIYEEVQLLRKEVALLKDYLDTYAYGKHLESSYGKASIYDKLHATQNRRVENGITL